MQAHFPPRPSLSITPGRKFSTTTSALRTNARAISRSEYFLRSRAMLCFPRFNTAFAAVFQQGPFGGSTRMIGALIGQKHSCQRPGKILPEINDTIAGQRTNRVASGCT